MYPLKKKSYMDGERLNIGRKGNCHVSLLTRTRTVRAINGSVDCSYFYTATIFMGIRFQVQMKVQSHLHSIDRKEPPNRFRLLFFVGIVQRFSIWFFFHWVSSKWFTVWICTDRCWLLTCRSMTTQEAMIDGPYTLTSSYAALPVICTESNQVLSVT